jgi:hypothetical protein
MVTPGLSGTCGLLNKRGVLRLAPPVMLDFNLQAPATAAFFFVFSAVATTV